MDNNHRSRWPLFTVVVLLAGAGGLGAKGQGRVAGKAARANQRPRTFFVDCDGGRDSDTGRTRDRAWRTLERVNRAELRPGDTVRFKRGGIWRGSLVPVSGTDGAPVTYTAYGDGPKPVLLGSLARNRTRDWVPIRNNIWATLPMEYIRGKELLDLRSSGWSIHKEGGAVAHLSQRDEGDGRVVRLICTSSGSAANHLQLWGPQLDVHRGTYLLMTFRARCTKPFRIVRSAIIKGTAPWTGFGTAQSMQRDISTRWQDFRFVFEITQSAHAGRLHINLGGALPAGSTFEFQPLSLCMATPSVNDPPTVDVGNIIFDDGIQCGWKKWALDELKNPYDFFYDRKSWRVYLYCARNPAALHHHIELALKRHIVAQGNAHHVVYDGLSVKYGAAHGFGGGNTHHLVIRNCDVSYIGGGHQTTRADGTPVRYGNGIEFWNAAHDNLVEYCRIWEIYDAALTNQGRAPTSHQINITYRNNVIWNAEYSFEYWNHPAAAVTRHIHFVHNTCVDAGKGWAHAQRPTPNGSHLMFYSNTAQSEDIEIKYNVFCGFTEWGSRYSNGWKQRPDIDYNLWFSQTGVMVNWFGKKIANFADYQRITGLDVHSLFADPRFLNPAKRDYRLGSDSPARALRTDGSMVGADLSFSPVK